MSLAASKSGLEQAIKQAFLNEKIAGEVDGSNPVANISALAAAIANAIHNYTTSAEVDITSVITTTAVPPVPTPVIATHAGVGSLK